MLNILWYNWGTTIFHDLKKTKEKFVLLLDTTLNFCLSKLTNLEKYNMENVCVFDYTVYMKDFFFHCVVCIWMYVNDEYIMTILYAVWNVITKVAFKLKFRW